ncbi:hypothetical protein C8Q76DRAFT_798449 [Earliella scabrosa]|nr:hypothetical protein C8Q76DRAFT_798449 [Earliella scabrosa]
MDSVVDQPAAITPVFSGASIELTVSPRHGKPFDTPPRGTPVQTVFVLVAAIAPSHVCIVARDNPYVTGPGDHINQGVFVEEVDETLEVAVDQSHLIVALKPEGFAVWYQFIFDHAIEFWGFLGAIAQTLLIHINRENLLQAQLHRLRHDFSSYFKPVVARSGYPQEIQSITEGRGSWFERREASQLSSASDSDTYVE